MNPATGFSKAIHAPISSRAFLDALSAVWNRPTGKGAPRFPKLALAVSGGVDSMALAVLCKGLNRDFPNSAVKLRAFVVDHAARRGSDVEASQVAKDIGKLKIRTNVLTLQWPNNVNPLELPNFESQARKLRYQALGTACKKYGIQSLLLGHHADDQAETVLMRLANGHRGLSLRGMNASAEIPECWGMHGVHLSGAIESKQTGNRKGAKYYNRRKLKEVKVASNEPEDIPVEAGGIKIYRPLLRFSKDQLIVTCRANKTRWVEDHTNQDPTLTPRNAIRHLLQGSSLPLALQRYSLLGLSHRLQHKEEYRAQRIEELFRACEIDDFHTRSGSLTIRFPKHILQDPSADPIVRARQIDRAGYMAAALLKRILELVTPQEVVRLRDMGSAVRTIFPDLPDPDPDPDSTETKRISTPASFTVAGVYCQPTPLPPSQPKIPFAPTHAWHLSRQPYPSSPTIPLPTCAFRSALLVPAGVEPAWSDWRLFDGRFWIRVQNRTNSTLIVRPFAEHDLKPFRHALDPDASASFETILNVQAPGGIRWTLPVLATKLDGRMLAAVSMGLGLPEVEDVLKWEVRFRAVDMPGWAGMVEGRGRMRMRMRKEGGKSTTMRKGKAKAKAKAKDGRAGAGERDREREGKGERQSEERRDGSKGLEGSVVRHYWL